VAEGTYTKSGAMAGLQRTVDFAKQHGYKILRSPAGKSMKFVNKELNNTLVARVDDVGDSIFVNFEDYSSGISGNDDASYFDETFKNAYEQALENHQFRQGVAEGSDKKVVIKPENEQEMLDWLESEGFDAPEPTTDDNGNLVYDFKGMDNSAYTYASDYDIGSEEADDDLSEQDVTEGGVAGPKNCWPGHRKVGTQPGTGKNAGKRVNDCEKIDEDEFAGNFATGEKAQWRNKGPKANQPAKVGDLVGANESIERDPLDDLKRLLGK
jgi:hypothetical protein